ncbi:MAG: hypothetical protein JW800_04530 [Candidatus Omnitrophica bacterium]|nr:hypothetical protein [Candidatus Omnitrophota bacterium]
MSNSINTGGKSRIVIRAVAVIEIVIGLYISLSFIIASLITPPGRPKTVYGFVVVTSLISIIMGIGLYRYKNWAKQFLIFFAGYIIFTKFLLFSNLVEFTGDTINFISIDLKDVISFIYHFFILLVFNLKIIKKELR